MSQSVSIAAAATIEGSVFGVAEGAPENPVLVETPTPVLSDAVKRHWLGGTAALATAVMVERGTGLLANVLAARFGGAAVFGTYSVAISTANNIGTYAAAGIGATATRFSGKYPYGSAQYGSLARALAIVSISSAAVAAIALWAGATPLAHLLGKPGLSGLLRWASLSAAAMILLECARGFFVGQRRTAALLLLSGAVGLGLLTVLPAAAHTHNATHMVLLQAAVCCGAVLLCLFLGRVMGLRSDSKVHRPSLLPMLREVWGFGFVQLSGMVASNLAGWWLTTLIARADTTLVQVGFFAIASQMRNLAGVVPGLLTEGSYAVMAMPEESRTIAGRQTRVQSRVNPQQRVMALSSYASTVVACLIASVGMLVAPWALQLLYGRAYVPAQAALAVALALAVAHMSNAPAAARLTIVNIRAAGLINSAWGGFVAVAATLFMLHGGGAWQGLSIQLGAHLFSAVLVLHTLRVREGLPQGMAAMYFAGALGTSLLAGMALVRAYRPQHILGLTGAMAVVAAVQLLFLLLAGRRHHWLPTPGALRALAARAMGRLRRQEVAHV